MRIIFWTVADLPRCGQAKLTIIFRGTGKRTSSEERAAWHPDVCVRFQKKAWADEAVCEDYALVEMAEITAAARLAGRESVAILDNLHGHTTEAHPVGLASLGCAGGIHRTRGVPFFFPAEPARKPGCKSRPRTQKSGRRRTQPPRQRFSVPRDLHRVIP